MNRTTNKIFKFIHKNGVSSLSILYKEFPNKNVVDESYNLLIKDKLIISRNGSIELTVDGYDYYYKKHKELILKIFKILISPIVVAVIASLITAKVVSPNNKCNCDVTCNYTNDNDINSID